MDEGALTMAQQVLGTTTVDAVRSAGGHSMVTTRTELSTTTGEALATSTSTIVVRGGEDCPWLPARSRRSRSATSSAR